MQLDAHLKSAAFRLPPMLLLGDHTEIPSTTENKPVPKRIQLLKVGTFSDPRYGEFAITTEMLASFKKNFESKVLDIDIMLDYAHNSDLEAAAWFTGLELSDDGQTLFGIVDWTPEGEAAVRTKKFRYVSADITSNFIHNETGKQFGPTLRGAGLTNRPVIKGMEPIVNLSEAEFTLDEGGELQSVVVTKEKAKTVADAKKIAQAVGAKSTDSVDETMDSYRFRQRDPKDFNDDSFRSKGIPEKGATLVYGHLKGKKLNEGDNMPEMSKEEKAKKLKDLAEQYAAITGKDFPDQQNADGEMDDGEDGEKPPKKKAAPADDGADDGDDDDGKDGDLKSKYAAMKKELAAMKAKMAEYEESKKMSEKKSAFQKLMREGKVSKAQEKAFMSMDLKLAEDLFKDAKPTNVNLSSIGHDGDMELVENDGTVEDEIKKLAEAKVKDKSAKDLGSAMSMVLKENPDLRRKYHERNNIRETVN